MWMSCGNLGADTGSGGCWIRKWKKIKCFLFQSLGQTVHSFRIPHDYLHMHRYLRPAHRQAFPMRGSENTLPLSPIRCRHHNRHHIHMGKFSLSPTAEACIQNRCRKPPNPNHSTEAAKITPSASFNVFGSTVIARLSSYRL